MTTKGQRMDEIEVTRRVFGAARTVRYLVSGPGLMRPQELLLTVDEARDLAWKLIEALDGEES